MIDILVNFLILLFTYILVFTVYFALVVFMSTKKRRLEIRQKYMSGSVNNNLVVIIYAQNNEKTVVPLLEQLNKQIYSKSNYQVHIILDNCTDDSANKLEFIGGAKIWRLSDGTPLGKDESVSWLLERLISFQNVNAFVFLNANRSIDADFLSAVNASLFHADVIVGSTEIVPVDDSFKTNLLISVNKYKNRIIRTGRSLLGLITRVDSDIAVIKQEVLEKIRCVDFKDVNSELKYTILLARNKFISTYNPMVKVFVSSDDYTFKKPDITYKMSLLKHCFPLLFTTNFKFTEFIFSLFKPNIFVFALIFTSIALFSNTYYFFYDFRFIMFVGVVLLTALIASFKIVEADKKTTKYLLIYPFYMLNEKYIKPLVNKLFLRKTSQLAGVETATIDVEVTDGKSVLPCKLDMISENGLVKVVFRFKNKKYMTDSCIRMCDAIKNITDKLTEHGFRIKICQTCAFFTPKIDGSTNMIKGVCGRNNDEDISQSFEKEVLLWNSCEFYLPQDINKVIDINQYKKKSE